MHRGWESAVRTPRRSMTQRRKLPSSSGSGAGPSLRSWTQRSFLVQGPRHESRSADHLEMESHARASGRVRATDPPLLVPALDRIRGCESQQRCRRQPSSSEWSEEPCRAQRERCEPQLLPPEGAYFHPRSARLAGAPGAKQRGGFKPGPKFPDGRQPSLTREDIAAKAEANRKPSADSRAER